jgi:hypothetical protein
MAVVAVKVAVPVAVAFSSLSIGQGFLHQGAAWIKVTMRRPDGDYPAAVRSDSWLCDQSIQAGDMVVAIDLELDELEEDEEEV